MAPLARTITVAPNMSKALDTINIHTLIRKLLQTNISVTLIKCIANYIKGGTSYRAYINYTPIQRQFKTVVLTHTITFTHPITSAVNRYIQPYLHKKLAWTKHYNFTLNPGKTTCILLTPDPEEYTNNLDLKINNTALPMATHPKPTYSTHIHTISVHAHKPLQIIKARTATGWGKQKATLMATYKVVMRPAMEYASSIWLPLASSTSIFKLHAMQNAALITATGCIQDTNIHHPHDETLTLPIHDHLQPNASQYK